MILALAIHGAHISASKLLSIVACSPSALIRCPRCLTEIFTKEHFTLLNQLKYILLPVFGDALHHYDQHQLPRCTQCSRHVLNMKFLVARVVSIIHILKRMWLELMSCQMHGS